MSNQFVFISQLAVAGETKMCIWMHEHQVDWIHKAPTLAGLALNLFFLIRIMWVRITKDNTFSIKLVSNILD